MDNTITKEVSLLAEEKGFYETSQHLLKQWLLEEFRIHLKLEASYNGKDILWSCILQDLNYFNSTYNAFLPRVVCAGIKEPSQALEKGLKLALVEYCDE